MFDTNAQQFSTHACITAFAWLIHLVSFHQYTFSENWPRLLHIFTENKETERAKYPQALNHGLIYICKKLLLIVKLCEISTVAKQCLLIFSIKVFYIEYFVVFVHVFHPLLIYIFDSKLISTSGCLLHQQQIAMIMDSFLGQHMRWDTCTHISRLFPNVLSRPFTVFKCTDFFITCTPSPIWRACFPNVYQITFHA